VWTPPLGGLDVRLLFLEYRSNFWLHALLYDTVTWDWYPVARLLMSVWPLSCNCSFSAYESSVVYIKWDDERVSVYWVRQ